MKSSQLSFGSVWRPVIIVAGLLFLYANVLAKLGYDWWTDDNYSHGLLVPFVIGYIIWLDLDVLNASRKKPEILAGTLIVAVAVLLLLGGTLASELFTQRMSLVIMLAGVAVYFCGRYILHELIVPFLLLILAIPIPQIIFNKIAFPLQVWASQAADWGIRFAGVATSRKGNVIELTPLGTTRVVGLEVVEACSGIRSLMTLVTLALILGYFTRERRENIGITWSGLVRDRDAVRIGLLMLAAVPIALITNAARVMTTGLLTYRFGPDAAAGFWHEAAGSFVFLTALILLIFVNFGLKRILRRPGIADIVEVFPGRSFRGLLISDRQTVALFTAILISGVFINWFQQRGEVSVERRPLNEIPARLGIWEQRGNDVRFDPESEKVLKASDYVMRNYFDAEKRMNVYIGYYTSQRSGATYHSPQNCLPGSGWEMKEPELIQIDTPGGKSFAANRYIVERGDHREILVYWYQGRGRITTSEYKDKLYTSLDSIVKRRSDGAMVRVMTPVGENEERSLAAVVDLSSQLEDNFGPFLPD